MIRYNFEIKKNLGLLTIPLVAGVLLIGILPEIPEIIKIMKVKEKTK